MTPLQEAAKAAGKVILAYCRGCDGIGQVCDDNGGGVGVWKWVACRQCKGSGVDTFNPHALIGAGIAALVATGRTVEIRTDSVWVKSGDEYEHHGVPTPTPEWIATAVLRLVARCLT